MERSNLLILELDRSAGAAAERLRQLGHRIERTREPAVAIGHLSSSGIDLVLMGEAASRDRLRFCSSVRARSADLPILLMGADPSERDALGRSSGPDDYVVREFDLDELEARVRSMLRRSFERRTIARAVPLAYGPLRIDAEGCSVAFGAREIRLTGTEYQLLCHLARAPERTFSRGELLRSVWGYEHSGYSHTLTTHVNRLRLKLERTLGAPRVIETVRGLGYRFTPAGTSSEEPNLTTSSRSGAARTDRCEPTVECVETSREGNTPCSSGLC